MFDKPPDINDTFARMKECALSNNFCHYTSVKAVYNIRSICLVYLGHFYTWKDLLATEFYSTSLVWVDDINDTLRVNEIDICSRVC